MIFDYARFKVRLLSSHDYDNKYHKPKGKHAKHVKDESAEVLNLAKTINKHKKEIF